MNDEVYFWHADKQRSLLQVDAIILGVCNQAYSLQYFQETMGDKVDFLPADKRESFQQVYSITLGVRS